MDCRASFLLTLILLSGTTGCAIPGVTGLMAPSHDEEHPPEVVNDKVKRTPHPETCLAAGRVREDAAENPKRTAADRDSLRAEACRAYQQALDIDPNYLEAYKALAHLYEVMGDPVRADATYQKALEGHPKEAGLWYEFGMCHARRKDWDSALTSLRKAAEADPENHTYTNTYGFCLARAGRCDESVAFFARLVGPARAHYNVARILHHLHQDERSQEQCRLALQADAQLADARTLLDQLAGKTPETGKGVLPVGFETVDTPAPTAGKDWPRPPRYGEGASNTLQSALPR